MLLLQTPRLFLRPFTLSDAESLRGVFCDPAMMRFGPGVQAEGWIMDWLDERLEEDARYGYSAWAVIQREGSGFLGYCGLFHFLDLDGQEEVEIGYRLVRSGWGYGYATEAVTAVRDHGFTVLHLPRLVALIDPGNTASLRVAEKAGMQYEKEVMLEDYTYPDLLYSVVNPARPVSSR